MEKENGIIAKGIAVVLAAIILINDVVGLFVTKQDHPLSLHGTFRTVYWIAFAAAFLIMTWSYFKCRPGKTKVGMVIALIILAIQAGIIYWILSVNKNLLAANSLIGFVKTLAELKISFIGLLIGFLVMTLLGLLIYFICVLLEATTRSMLGFILLAIFGTKFCTFMLFLFMHHFGAFIFLAMVIGVILFVSSKAQKRRPVSKNYRSGGTSSQRPTYASQNHSSNDSSSLGYSSSGYSSSTSSNDSGNHEAERREIDRYDRLIEDAQKDIEYQEEAKRDYVRYRDEARRKGGKVGLYSAEEYEDFIRNCDYKIDDLKRRKKEYEADRDRIRRSIR